MAGVVELLAHYPPPVIEAILSPIHGLPGKHKFIPLIAEIREACEAEMAPIARQMERERVAKMSDHLLSGPSTVRELPRISSSRSALCAKYGVSAIPPGWDAVDMAQASARFGSGLAEQVEKICQSDAKPPRTAFSRVVETARQAMQAKQSEEQA